MNVRRAAVLAVIALVLSLVLAPPAPASAPAPGSGARPAPATGPSLTGDGTVPPTLDGHREDALGHGGAPVGAPGVDDGEPPVIGVAPPSFALTLLSGQEQVETLVISNGGASPLTFWIDVVPAGPAVLRSAFAGLSATSGKSGNPEPLSPVDAEPAPTPYDGADGTFETLTASPVPLTCIAADPANAILYAQEFNGVRFFRYDPATTLWQRLVDSPFTSGNNGGAAWLNGRIYTAYADNAAWLGVYDVATGAWTAEANPLHAGTTNIASDGSRYLYLAVSTQVVRYDPATGEVTPLATPPFGFEPWGGLAYDSGVLYGHQGNGLRAFARYDVASGMWTSLPSVPGGTVAGAAIDRVAHQYVVLGSYSGTNVYSYGLTTGTWTVETLPAFVANDTGLAWMPSHPPALYIPQGQGGTGFLRRVGAAPWLRADPSSGTVPPGGSTNVAVHFDAATLGAGRYLADLRVSSNDPVTPLVVVPTQLDVVGAPDIAVTGVPVLVESAEPFQYVGTTTHHALPTPIAPGADGTIELVADGDFGLSTETADLSLEGRGLGSVGGVGADCVAATGTFPLAAADLAQAAADGVVEVDVRNSIAVDIFCTTNLHTVRLRYTGAGDRIDFGTQYSGEITSREVRIENRGTEVLEVTSIVSSRDEFIPLASSLTIAAGASQALGVAFRADAAGLVEGTLSIASNDADEPVVTVALRGDAIAPPVIEVSPPAIGENLLSGQVAAHLLTIVNAGGSDLAWSAWPATQEQVLAASPVFHEPDPQATIGKPEAVRREGPPPEERIYRQPAPATDGAPAPDAGADLPEPPLEDVLARIDASYQAVTSRVPDLYLFTEGVTGSSILDGGDDMYDGGNYLSTYWASSIPYSDGAVVRSSAFGTTGRYFTRKVPGLFVLGADLSATPWFAIDGDLGTDGAGSVDGVVLTLAAGSQQYRGFVKRVWGTTDPSVNHLVIMRLRDGVTQGFSTYPNDDYHYVSSLGSVDRIYYLLFASARGRHVDDTQMLDVMKAFVGAIENMWLRVAPPSGTIPPGGSADLTVTLDATGYGTADLAGSIEISSNDPVSPSLAVPVTVHVTGAPDIAILGVPKVVESVRTYNGYYATTDHVLNLPAPPQGAGSIELVAEGDYGASYETATATAEGTALGSAGGTGYDCTAARKDFPLSAADLDRLASDLVVNVNVRNSYDVDASCAVNRHTVRLHYREPGDRLEFGELFVGARRALELEIANVGTEVLTIGGVDTGRPEFVPAETAFTIPPGGTHVLVVEFAPSAPESVDAVLAITSDDGDEPRVTVSLHGTGLVPPAIGVDPASFVESFLTGEVVTRTLTLSNTGGADLVWSADPSETSRVATASPAFTDGAAGAQPDVYTAGPGAADAGGAGGADDADAPLESVLARLDRRYDRVTGLVPARYDFLEGETGSSIVDGGANMYDYGNYLYTNGGSYLSYTNGTIVASPAFGVRGRYFTRKYPGLFVLAADLDSISYFQVDGSLGYRSGALVDGSVLDLTVGGVRYLGFVKRVSGGAVPSVNHLVLVPYAAGVDHQFSTYQYYDYHRVQNLGTARRLYYLLFASQTGGYVDDAAALAIAREFLRVAGLDWLTVTPDAGTIPAGGSAGLAVTFDASGFATSDHGARIDIRSNDPLAPVVRVPVSMHVTGAPNIVVGGAERIAESKLGYASSGASTHHELVTAVPPSGGGALEVLIDGDYGDSYETATVVLESRTLGTLGATGLDCSQGRRSFPLTARDLELALADGRVIVDLQNTYDVNPTCGLNQHTVRLHYAGAADALDFGDLFVGVSGTQEFRIDNTGSDPLQVTAITAGHPDFTVAEPSFVLAPGGTKNVAVTFRPSDAVVRDTVLSIASDDPDQPLVTIALHGTGLVPPDIDVAPAALSESLFAGEARTAHVTISNSGGSALFVRAAVGPAASASAPPAEPAGPAAGDPRRTAPRPEEGPDGLAGGVMAAGEFDNSAGEALPFHDGFESGTLDAWSIVYGSSVRDVTNATAAAGNYSHHQLTSTSGSHYSGVYRALGSQQPRYVSFWVRSETAWEDTAYVVLTTSQGDDLVWFFASHSGFLYINGDVGGDQSVPVVPGAWRHVELALDFDARSFDYKVDGRLVRSAIPFRPVVGTVDVARIDLYNYTYGSVAYWDEITISEKSAGWARGTLEPTTLAPGESIVVPVAIDAADLDGGDYAARLEVLSNDPDEPVVTVPIALHVTGAPSIRVAGPVSEAASSITYGVDGATTRHEFPLERKPLEGSLTVAIDGDYGDYYELASVTVEGVPLAQLGGVGTDCSPGTTTLRLPASILAHAADDGVLTVDVSNSADVGVFCTRNVHTVSIALRGEAGRVDFGDVFVGFSRDLQVEVRNLGTDVLVVDGIATGSPGVVALVPGLTVPAHGSALLPLRWTPQTDGPLEGDLVLSSNDPLNPTLAVPLGGAALWPPLIVVRPAAVSAALLPGDVVQAVVEVGNDGGSGLDFTTARGTARALPPPPPRAADAPDGPSDLAPSSFSGPAPEPVALAGGTVLMVQDVAPWDFTGYPALFQALGVTCDVIRSSSLAATDLRRYKAVLIPSDQTSAFYAALAAAGTQLADYVAGGGVLEVHAAPGWNGGDSALLPLPRGVLPRRLSSATNRVIDAAHPITAGVPATFTASYASHDYFEQLPADATTLVVDSAGHPTLVLYTHGAGLVIAAGQTLEYLYSRGYGGGQLLPNMVTFAAQGAEAWLRVAPEAGAVAAHASFPVTLTLDATGMAPGVYGQSVLFRSNDPYTPELALPVKLSVVRLLAAAGADTTAECQGAGQARVALDGSASRHVDGPAAIASYAWFEGGVPLGTGPRIEVNLPVGRHDLQLQIRDAAGDASSDQVVVTVVDTIAPSGSIVAPAAGACFGPGALPVVVADDFADGCSGAVARAYSNPEGAVYERHGDHDVTLVATDAAGNASSAAVAFTIDTAAPSARILVLPEQWTFPVFLPFQEFFLAGDDDGARGDVVHETIAVDGCVVYDGATFGDGDGRLLDEVAPLGEDEMCRLVRICGVRTWDAPVVTVTATDCGGNTTETRMVKPGQYFAPSRCP